MNRAKQIRLDRGAGLEATAVAAGMSTKTLKKVEAGRDVTAAALARLSTFYGVKASELLAPAHFEAPNGEAAA